MKSKRYLGASNSESALGVGKESAGRRAKPDPELMHLMQYAGYSFT